MQKHSHGFIPLFVLLMFIGVSTVGIGAGVFLQNSKNQRLNPLPATKSLSDSAKPKSFNKAKAKKPAPAAKPKPAVLKPAPIKIQKVATPKPAPQPLGKVYISSDGCWATAIGKEGMKFVVGAYRPNAGGNSDYTIPKSGTLVLATGGFKGMTGFGTLYDANGNKIATASTTITATSCPPASEPN